MRADPAGANNNEKVRPISAQPTNDAGQQPAQTAGQPTEAGADGWELPLGERVAQGGEDGALLIDIDGYSGPLDLLLALARTHKVDLSRLSVLALAEQYLAFIAEAKRLNLEIAADYLVMAAWLAFLKSRLLLPKEREDVAEPSGEELAARLAFRLQRLEAMRRAAADLMTRNRLGLHVFGRGCPEPVRNVRETTYTADIVDLLKAYARQRVQNVKTVHVVKRRTVWSIKEARTRLERLMGEVASNWRQLDDFISTYLELDHGDLEPGLGRTVRASSFGASLEMAREGLVEIRQEVPFGPIYMRRKERGSDWEPVG